MVPIGQSNGDGNYGEFGMEIGYLLRVQLIYQKRHLCVGYLQKSNSSNPSSSSFTQNTVRTLRCPQGTSGFQTTIRPFIQHRGSNKKKRKKTLSTQWIW